MPGVLRLTGVRKAYGEVVALDGVDFAVARGEIVGFLGPNGAGKTTAMRVVMGVARPDAGEATWDGKPIDQAARERFGYMPEERGLYPRMTARAQLTYFARLHGMAKADAVARAEQWLERVGVPRPGDKVERLSQGNQQRVQLGVALVHDPELLVLDEPFSGLDPLGVDLLSSLLREEVKGGRAVLFSSHQLDLVEDVCDRVVLLNAGKVVLSGTLDEVAGPGESRTVLVRPPLSEVFRQAVSAS